MLVVVLLLALGLVRSRCGLGVVAGHVGLLDDHVLLLLEVKLLLEQLALLPDDDRLQHAHALHLREDVVLPYVGHDPQDGVQLVQVPGLQRLAGAEDHYGHHYDARRDLGVLVLQVADLALDLARH